MRNKKTEYRKQNKEDRQKTTDHRELTKRYMIRKAKIGDIREIHRLLSAYSAEGSVLPRSLSELYDQLRDFFVYTDTSDTVIGTCAMHICWDKIAEIRSLAVKDGYKGKGIGDKLVKECIKEAQQLEVEQIFVLTYATKFFRKFAFKKVDKAILPHKVWSDCMKCVKFPDCDEEAMLLKIRQ
jgi:amino-acid N-acetyltransferase